MGSGSLILIKIKEPDPIIPSTKVISLALKKCRCRVLSDGSFGGRDADVEPPGMEIRRLPAESTRQRHDIEATQVN